MFELLSYIALHELWKCVFLERITSQNLKTKPKQLTTPTTTLFLDVGNMYCSLG